MRKEAIRNENYLWLSQLHTITWFLAVLHCPRSLPASALPGLRVSLTAPPPEPYPLLLPLPQSKHSYACQGACGLVLYTTPSLPAPALKNPEEKVKGAEASGRLQCHAC